jgi:hypothetical protein
MNPPSVALSCSGRRRPPLPCWPPDLLCQTRRRHPPLQNALPPATALLLHVVALHCSTLPATSTLAAAGPPMLRVLALLLHALSPTGLKWRVSQAGVGRGGATVARVGRDGERRRRSGNGWGGAALPRPEWGGMGRAPCTEVVEGI